MCILGSYCRPFTLRVLGLHTSLFEASLMVQGEDDFDYFYGQDIGGYYGQRVPSHHPRHALGAWVVSSSSRVLMDVDNRSHCAIRSRRRHFLDPCSRREASGFWMMRSPRTVLLAMDNDMNAVGSVIGLISRHIYSLGCETLVVRGIGDEVLDLRVCEDIV